MSKRLGIVSPVVGLPSVSKISRFNTPCDTPSWAWAKSSPQEMQVDSADSPMAFEGTVADDGSITSTFDETFANDDGSLRLVGDWVASPIE